MPDALYFVYTGLLLLGVLLAPALAVWPVLVTRPLSAIAIPWISLLIVMTLAACLTFFHCYTHQAVLLTTCSFSAIALIRLRSLRGKVQQHWRREDCAWWVIAFSIVLPLIAMAGWSSFSSDDGIQSWNYWAVQHVLADPLISTSYPQGFSWFISYCYQLLGSVQYHGAVKALFFLFPLTSMLAILMSAKRPAATVITALVLVLVAAFPDHNFALYRFFTTGYADGIFAAAMTLTVTYFIQYHKDRDASSWLMLMVACGVLAAFLKQPGLLWCLISLPALAVAERFFSGRWDKRLLLAMVVSALPPLIWQWLTTHKFYDNLGVVRLVGHLHQTHGSLFLFALKNILLGSPSLDCFGCLLWLQLGMIECVCGWFCFFYSQQPSLGYNGGVMIFGSAYTVLWSVVSSLPVLIILISLKGQSPAIVS